MLERELRNNILLCPNCRNLVEKDFLICPVCNWELKKSWSNCEQADQHGVGDVPVLRHGAAQRQEESAGKGG